MCRVCVCVVLCAWFLVVVILCMCMICINRHVICLFVVCVVFFVCLPHGFCPRGGGGAHIQAHSCTMAQLHSEQQPTPRLPDRVRKFSVCAGRFLSVCVRVASYQFAAGGLGMSLSQMSLPWVSVREVSLSRGTPSQTSEVAGLIYVKHIYIYIYIYI